MKSSEDYEAVVLKCVNTKLLCCYSQSKSCSGGRHSQPFVRGTRRHCGYSRARCSYRRAVDASLSVLTTADKSLLTSSYMDSLTESKSCSSPVSSLSVEIHIYFAGVADDTWQIEPGA